MHQKWFVPYLLHNKSLDRVILVDPDLVTIEIGIEVKEIGLSDFICQKLPLVLLSMTSCHESLNGGKLTKHELINSYGISFKN
jgi:hypothetical protein